MNTNERKILFERTLLEVLKEGKVSEKVLEGAKFHSADIIQRMPDEVKPHDLYDIARSYSLAINQAYKIGIQETKST